MFTFDIKKNKIVITENKDALDIENLKLALQDSQKAETSAKNKYTYFMLNLFIYCKGLKDSARLDIIKSTGMHKSHASEISKILKYFYDNNETSERFVSVILANSKDSCLRLARGGNVHLNGNVIEKNERSASHVRKTQKASETSETSEASEASEASERSALTSFNVKTQLDVLIKSLLSQQARYVVLDALKQATQTLTDEIAKNEAKSKKQAKKAA